MRLSAALFRVLAVGLGAGHTVAAALRQSMSEDGISYLDMGDAYVRGDWGMAVNSVWSPLYAWILGVAMRVVKPSMEWEFPLVHLVNFGIYLLALACFEFFWRRLTETVRETRGREEAGFPEWAWISVGYSLFIWTSLSLTRVWAVTPDMLVAALVYLASGLLLRIEADPSRRKTHAAYGLVLGLAYLAKSVMLPLGFAFLAALAAVRRPLRGALPCLVVALSAFLVVALPYTGVLSTSKGRLTFGEAGRLTYLRVVNRAPYPFWRPGLVSGLGEPVHPARQVHEDPAVYEFGAPIGGTYPLSYDPSYWYEGVSARFHPREQMAALLSNGSGYFELFVRRQGGFLGVTLLLLLVGLGGRTRELRMDGRWTLVGVAVVAFALYALVYVEGRYLAPFVTILWAGLLSHVSLPASGESRKVLAVSGGVLALFVLLNIAAFNVAYLNAFLGLEVAPHEEPGPGQSTAAVSGTDPEASPPEVARALRELGIRPQDRIGFIGYGFGAYFARLTRARIVAQVPEEDAAEFWAAEPSRRRSVLDAFARAGARAVVTERMPSSATREGWMRLGETGHGVYLLVSDARASAMSSGRPLSSNVSATRRWPASFQWKSYGMK